MKPKFNFGLAGALLLLCALAIAVFRVLKELGWVSYLVVLIVYGVISLVMGLWYVIYNRGFVGKKITDDMLPVEWTKEEKDNFLNDLTERRKKSKWMMLVIIPMIATFLFEAVDVYMLDSIRSLFVK